MTRKSNTSFPNKVAFARAILDWYDTQRRDLPWRANPGQSVDPYHVLVSEFMLQQTTVATVQPRFAAFIRRWPRLADLAQASEDQVLQAWSGLGYYRRARYLHACARAAMAGHNGQLPADPDELARLPGIGPYTAAALAAIAFDVPAAAVDGNIERVLARVLQITTPLPAAKAQIYKVAQKLVPLKRAGDYTQALMDLGASHCAPRSPDCPSCPVSRFCQAYRHGDPASLPARAPRKGKKEIYELAYWAQDDQGRVLLRRRPEGGLLGGMLDLPCHELTSSRAPGAAQIGQGAPLKAVWTLHPQTLKHIFTHRALHRHLAIARVTVSPSTIPKDSFWLDGDAIAGEAISTLFNKSRHMAMTLLAQRARILILGLGLWAAGMGLATAAEPATPVPAAPAVVTPPAPDAKTPPAPTRRPNLSGDAVVEDPRTITFLPVTLDRLASLLLRYKAVDISRDDVIDEFARLFQCEIYEYNHHDEFLWKKAQVALRRDIQKRMMHLPTHMEFFATRRLGKYDFKRQMFLLHRDSPINKLSSFTFSFSDQQIDVPCLEGASSKSWFPYTYKVSLDYPLTLEGLPMNEAKAKDLLNSMLQADNPERVIYVRFRFDVVHVPPMKRQQDEIDMEAEMQQVDFFEDKQLRRLIYSYQPYYQ